MFSRIHVTLAVNTSMNLLNILDGTPEPPIVDLHLENVNDSGMYDLATPMYEFQKELTDQIVSLHYPDILKYCETDDTRELITKSLEICIENCMLVSTHPYLLISHYMPKNLTSKDMSHKIAETSGKFNVLRDLVNVIIDNSSKKTVGIVMKNNSRFFDLTEALLLGCTGSRSVRRYVGNNLRKEVKGRGLSGDTEIHLIPHDGVVQKHQDILNQTKFDILIVFDLSVDTDGEFFTELRHQNQKKDAIFIRLVPMRTIEHCKLYYAGQQHEKTYLYKLISSIVCLRDQVGNLPPDIVPIYNQNLRYFGGFFESLFKGRRFPTWPLPELPAIPNFSAVDVERSLLTEVHFHYTPYDSADNVIDHVPNKTVTTASYYETKRLESDYITNPLKNDYNKLLGILSSEVKQPDNKHILTHRLIMQLNNSWLEADRVRQEVASYEHYALEQRQLLVGRRHHEYQKTLCSIREDVDHAEQRILIAENKSARFQAQTDEVKQEIEALEAQIAAYGEKLTGDDKQFVDNQREIWRLQSAIKDTVAKIQLKSEERTYMATEHANAVQSIEESKAQVQQVTGDIAELKRTIEAAFEAEVQEAAQHKKLRESLQRGIDDAREENTKLKVRLGKSLKFLRETLHLRKRKGRGLTPNVK